MIPILTKLNEARQKLPLKSLMEKRGRGPTNGNWKSFPKCPYCDGKKTAGVFLGPHGDLFKCHHTTCRSATASPGAAWDEIGFLSFELGCSRKAATRAWLEEAGLWDQKFKPLLTDSKPKISPDDSAEALASNADEATDCADFDSKSPLAVFYDSLLLSAADREELKAKRGLTDEMIDASGFKTNCQTNQDLLLSLAENYDEWILVRSGLWTRKTDQAKPSGQFYGYGVVGKKKKISPQLLASGHYEELEDDDFVWAWKESGNCNPILIPYFNLKGDLVALRPHKGFPKGQQPRLYIAGGKKAVKECRRAVIVEGEFKAAALQSVVGSDWAIASVPGITMVKNLDVWGDVLAWLKSIGAKEVIVAFDNEEQSNPALSTFRLSIDDRFEAEVWARVCATQLAKESYIARVAALPDDWRNENGKADWDSALVALLKAGKSRAEITRLFVSVLRSAHSIAELKNLKLFGDEGDKSVRNRVAVRTHEPALPWGGEREQRLAKHLRRLAREVLPEWKNRILNLAESYEKTAGHYYELKISELRREKLQAELAQAETLEQIKFLHLALKGTPTLVAPFRLIPYYVMVKPDGTRVRLVRLRNIRGESTDLIALDSNSFTAPRDFRRWLAQNGNYSWHGGERQLQALQQDIDFIVAYRDVIQLVCYGCEHPGQLWVLDDCAYAEDGTEIYPDHDSIFWHDGKGYKFLRNADGIPRGEEDQAFRLKSPPQMHPDQGLVFDPEGQLCLIANVRDDLKAIQELFGSFVVTLNESYGGFDGAMLIGATTAYFAGPEIFAEYNQFPGIWIHGEKGGGKSYTARFLIALHGHCRLEAGISFKTSSAVGLQIAMGQYANIPIWGDEYKETELRDSNVIGVIHAGFNRELPSKWSADGRTRTVRSALLITGESTCSNAATMSRFISVIAAREKRTGTNEDQRRRLEWLERHRQFLFTIGRAVLRNRSKFGERLKAHLKEWESMTELAAVEPRARFTYGVSYASFLALNELIPIYDSAQCLNFRHFMIRKAREAAEELAIRVDVSQFLIDVVNAYHAGVFGRSPVELQRFFKFSPNPKSCPPLSPRQLQDGVESTYRAWQSGIFYFQPGPIIDALRKYKHSQGQALALDQADLYAQLKFREYFVHPPKRQGHQKKFGKGSQTNQYCWAIDLDKLPGLGLNLVSDDEWQASFHPDGDTSQKMLPSHEWVDPRKGTLFAIVDALKEKEAES